jgi:hypothetical protein
VRFQLWLLIVDDFCGDQPLRGASCAVAVFDQTDLIMCSAAAAHQCKLMAARS